MNICVWMQELIVCKNLLGNKHNAKNGCQQIYYMAHAGAWHTNSVTDLMSKQLQHMLTCSSSAHLVLPRQLKNHKILYTSSSSTALHTSSQMLTATTECSAAVHRYCAGCLKSARI